MESATRPRLAADAQRSFQDVLRQVDIFALDMLVHHMGFTKSLASARLSCKAMRSAVNGSVKKAKITITAAAWENHVEKLQFASPLRLLPRCSSIHVSVVASSRNVLNDEDGWSHLVPSWLFSGVPADRRQCIWQIKLSVDENAAAEPAFLHIIPLLTSMLPALRTLDLSEVMSGVWKNSSEQDSYVMFATLANSCPQLESLVMPSWACLHGLGALAVSLRRLEVVPSNPDGPVFPASRGLSAAVEQLSQLHELQLYNLDFDTFIAEGISLADGLPMVTDLLNSLPPSLEHLELGNIRLAHTIISLSAWIQGGQVRFLKADGTVGVASTFLHYLADLVLSWRMVGSKLPELQLSRLLVINEVHLGNNKVSELVDRCDNIHVDWMAFLFPLGDDTFTDTMIMMELPSRLTFGNIHTPVLDLRRVGPEEEFVLWESGAEPAGVEAGAQRSLSPAGVPTALDLGSVTLDDVVRAVVDRLQSSQLAGPVLNVGTGTEPDSVGGNTVVLMRGPFFRALGPGRIVLEWLQSLAEREGVIGNGSGYSVVSCIELPAADAILMRCTTHSSAKELAAAASGLEGMSIQTVMPPTSCFQHALEIGLRPVLQELWLGSRTSYAPPLARMEKLATLWQGVAQRQRVHNVDPGDVPIA